MCSAFVLICAPTVGVLSSRFVYKIVRSTIRRTDLKLPYAFAILIYSFPAVRMLNTTGKREVAENFRVALSDSYFQADFITKKNFIYTTYLHTRFDYKSTPWLWLADVNVHPNIFFSTS